MADDVDSCSDMLELRQEGKVVFIVPGYLEDLDSGDEFEICADRIQFSIVTGAVVTIPE